MAIDVTRYTDGFDACLSGGSYVRVGGLLTTIFAVSLFFALTKGSYLNSQHASRPVQTIHSDRLPWLSPSTRLQVKSRRFELR